MQQISFVRHVLVAGVLPGIKQLPGFWNGAHCRTGVVVGHLAPAEKPKKHISPYVFQVLREQIMSYRVEKLAEAQLLNNKGVWYRQQQLE